MLTDNLCQMLTEYDYTNISYILKIAQCHLECQLSRFLKNITYLSEENITYLSEKNNIDVLFDLKKQLSNILQESNNWKNLKEKINELQKNVNTLQQGDVYEENTFDSLNEQISNLQYQLKQHFEEYLDYKDN